MTEQHTLDLMEDAKAKEELLIRLASMPSSVEIMSSTWNPPEWEEIVEWWDRFVSEARAATGAAYRRSK